MPVVSILMVCHRDTPYLRPAIASVFGQTFPDFELVLVDNGAGLTPDLLGEAGRDPRLRWVRNGRNMGIPAGHNAGVAAARGEFIALLDHDDLMLPRRLERQVARLRAEPALGLVSSLAETIDAEGRVVGREFALVDGEMQHRYTQYACPVVTPAYTGRRAIFLELPYRSEFSLTADFDFLARAAEQYNLGAVSEVLLRYRRHTAQTTQQHATAIEKERGVVRLLTALRRAGREEVPARPIIDALVGANPAAGSLACSGLSLTEGYPLLAAYQARRAIALSRTPRVAWRAGVLALRALHRSRGAERQMAMRLFFLGPVRALGLKPDTAGN